MGHAVVKFGLAAALLAGCYPGVDNSDCAIRCGENNACPSNLSCVSSFCVDEGQTCFDPDLVLAYSFDDIEDGMVVDRSPEQNTAGVAGDPMTVAGKHGNALAFDGEGDFLITRHSPSLAVAPAGAYTVSMWVLVEPMQEFVFDQILVAKVWMNDETVSPFYEFGVEFDQATNSIELIMGDENNNLHTGYEIPIDPGTFVHIAFTWDGRFVHGYRDGIEVPFPDPELEIVVPDRGQNLVIGSQSQPSEFFTGKLDDLRIYRRALAAEEIVSDRDSAVGP